MKINVENFGKIESANITIGDYTVFVGDNNSGKTYLMQLIYGTLQALCKGLSANNPTPMVHANCEIVEKVANEWLNEKKDQIVLETFKKKVSIGSLKIELERKELDFDVRKMTLDEYRTLRGSSDFPTFEQDEVKNVFAISINKKPSSYYVGFSNENKLDDIMQDEMLRCAIRTLLGHPLHKRAVYLPASRSGLMLTRPFIFANKQNEDVHHIEPISKFKKNNENEFGLTQPVYDFLQFLQTHKTSEAKSERRKTLVSFINKNIIHGQLKKTENESFYQPEGSDEWLPPSITSSMVNEISPIMQIITSVRDASYIFYDEIETCQHPTTQIQMARLLNRLINSGYKMVVSTHSDTMAAAISNLITLSFIQNRLHKTVELGYEEADLLKNAKIVHAYQFIKNKNGRSVVQEVPHYANIGLGFDFTLFNKANKKLYEDHKVIVGGVND